MNGFISQRVVTGAVVTGRKSLEAHGREAERELGWPDDTERPEVICQIKRCVHTVAPWGRPAGEAGDHICQPLPTSVTIRKYGDT